MRTIGNIFAIDYVLPEIDVNLYFPKQINFIQRWLFSIFCLIRALFMVRFIWNKVERHAAIENIKLRIVANTDKIAASECESVTKLRLNKQLERHTMVH